MIEDPETGDLNIILGPTQYSFATDDAHIVQIIGPFGEGKGLRYQDIILTPEGWVRAEDIKLGQVILSSDGKPTKVIGIYPQPTQQFWKLLFSDGTSAEVTEDHLWEVRTEWDRDGGAKADARDRRSDSGKWKTKERFHRKSRGQKVVTTKEIVDALRRGRWKSTGRWAIPLTLPVQFPHKDVPIDPYLLGVLIGDGSLAVPKVVKISTADEEILESVKRCLPLGMVIHKVGGKTCDYALQMEPKVFAQKNVLMKLLSEIGVLGCHSWNKFVPREYLWNDPEIRLAILQGLLDTDGTVLRHSNSVSFSTTSAQLALDVIFLIQSLGGIAKQRMRYTNFTYKGKKRNGRPSFHISVRLPNGVNPFRLTRKASKVHDKGERNAARRYIVGCEPAGIAPGVCFKVDNPSGLFLIHDFICTHNTVAGIVGLIVHAARCGRPIRAAIIRDTFQNIKISTKRDMEEYLGSQVRFMDNGRSCVIYSSPQVDVDLFGIDDPASMSKLQGPQYACIWLEEPAPIIEKANAGLSKDVFNFALTRASRQRDTVLRVQITQNPADESHWSAKLAEEPDEYMTVIDENTQEVTSIIKHVYRIKPGENKFLSALSRAAVKAAFKDDPEKWARYVEGKEASISLGKKVTSGYNSLIHFSPKILPVLPGDGIQMWDGWGHPCCILAQWHPVGLGEAKQLVIHDVLTDEGIGTKELIQEQVLPMLNSPKWKNKIRNWQVIGDPSMATMDQSSIRSSARREIEQAFSLPEAPCKFQLGPKDWAPRREPLNHALKEMLSDGQPAILLSRSAVKLHRALRGGWHYKVDNSGNVIGNKPIQNSEESHPGNAFSYGIAILKPYSPRKEFEKKMDQARERRIMGYGSSFRASPASIVMPQRTTSIIRNNASSNKKIGETI